MLLELPVQTLRGDVVTVIAATFIASLGVAALALYVLRRRATDVTALAFALFALMYASRLAIATLTIQTVLSPSGGPWGYVNAALTYAILPAGAWMGETLLGSGWRGSLRTVRTIALIIAPIGIAGMFVTGRPEWLMFLNNVLVLGMLAAIGATLARSASDRSTVLIRAGVVTAALFIFAENLRSLGVLRWPPRMEFIGILAFVSSMAFAVADRFLRREGRLAAVDRELTTARRIQQSILPQRVPQLQRFRLAVTYLPMTEVAGDFYDFLNLGESSTTILMADVSGHGVPAALIASMVKVTAASSDGAVADPGALLSAMSRRLDGQLGGQFLTAVSVHLDGERHEIAYAGAGHPPVLHWHAAEQKLEMLHSEGLLIGLVPAQYTSRRAAVRPGDRLFVYTDGVLEATDKSGSFFGDERFQTTIARHATKSCAELGASILEEMTRWSDNPVGFNDDVTLIVVEVE